jgi:hypothetical protein
MQQSSRGAQMLMRVRAVSEAATICRVWGVKTRFALRDVKICSRKREFRASGSQSLGLARESLGFRAERSPW